MNILMFEDNPGDVRLIQELLKAVEGARCNFEQADRLSKGIKRLETNSIDIILLDLGLKDSQGIDTLQTLSTYARKLPIIVMTGLDDEGTAVRALQHGAQDYLIKGQVEGATLWRCLRYAVERKRAQQQNELSLKIMEILNKPGEQREIVRQILFLIKDFSRVAAVGMRLKQGDDYPYYETDGFVPGHVESENYLCERKQDGTIALNSRNKPVLSGLCGQVLYRRFDPEQPFFTKAGSFWTNSISDLRDSTPDKDRPPGGRTRCRMEGYQSVALIPLKAEDNTVGLLHLCDQNQGRFTEDFIQFIEGIGQSIGAILARKKAEDDLKVSYGLLRNSLNKTISTVARIVEMRDPYTSGHQIRVANLSRAIATEMNMDEDMVNQVWMAATVHDVGKMLIPADLLSRPGNLTSLEWQIIKTHPQSGYDILKDVEFPFPIAKAILQHHERLDGSGYPYGLKDGEILPAARIIAVADVVEAMASHRPYRPALVLEQALEEISCHSGILYDPDVVKACRTLFLEKGYRLEKIASFWEGRSAQTQFGHSRRDPTAIALSAIQDTQTR
jgi:putative nucleotidyltransferase with HDIG domain